jgi:hypothetical protein
MEKKTITLRSKKSKYVRSFISSSVFVVLSFKLLLLTGSFLWLIPMLIFILGMAASFIPLLPNQSYLKVDTPGITIRSMFKTIHIKWDEVENFYSEKKANRYVVSFSFIQKKYNYMNLENLTGKKERLPDDYGMEADKLADLLEYYRIRHSY